MRPIGVADGGGGVLDLATPQRHLRTPELNQLHILQSELFRCEIITMPFDWFDFANRITHYFREKGSRIVSLYAAAMG